MNGASVVELTRRLVRVPSPNPGGDERAVAAEVTDVMGELGLPAPRTVAKHPDRPNLVSTLDFGPGGHHLVLSGHLDTKPVGDAVWSVDPFGADVDGDRLHGLGAADMKGAVAAMLLAAASLGQRPPARGRLTLVLVADEEDGARFGARHVCDELDLGADAVVIGEPGGLREDWDRLHLVSHGIARMRLTAAARQGHSSLAQVLHLRNSGVDVARAVVAVADRTALRVPDNPAGLLEWQATVNPGLRFTGGVGYGVLPDAVEAACEVRVLPGSEQQEVLAAVRAALAADPALSAADLRVEFDEAPSDFLPATAVDPEHAVVGAAHRACAAVLGARPPLAAFPGTTDATWFAASGWPTLPALGPGLLHRCHAADEWVSVAALQQAVPLYAHLAADFCGQEVG